MNDIRIGYRGYVTSRSFGGYSIPVPLQSLALRDYCVRNKMVYILPVNENCFPHSYMVLEGLIQDLSSFQGLIMYSMKMLPQLASRRLKIYNKIFEQNCTMHLVLENIIISSLNDVKNLEDLVLFDQLSVIPKVTTI